MQAIRFTGGDTGLALFAIGQERSVVWSLLWRLRWVVVRVPDTQLLELRLPFVETREHPRGGKCCCWGGKEGRAACCQVGGGWLDMWKRHWALGRLEGKSLGSSTTSPNNNMEMEVQ